MVRNAEVPDHFSCPCRARSLLAADRQSTDLPCPSFQRSSLSGMRSDPCRTGSAAGGVAEFALLSPATAADHFYARNGGGSPLAHQKAALLYSDTGSAAGGVRSADGSLFSPHRTDEF